MRGVAMASLVLLQGCVLAMVDRPSSCEDAGCPGNFACDYGECLDACDWDFDCQDGYFCYDDGTCDEPCRDACEGHYACDPEDNRCASYCSTDRDCAEGYWCCTYEKWAADRCDDMHDCYPD